MKKLCCILVIIFVPVVVALAGEEAIAPFLPPAKESVPRTEAVSISELPGGPAAQGDAFRSERSLNGVWKLTALQNSSTPFADDIDFDKGYAEETFDDSAWKDVIVPMDWFQTPACAQDTLVASKPHYKGWYRTTFDLNKTELSGRRIVLRFGCIAYESVVFINAREAGRHTGDFTGFELDVTDLVKEGKNTLAIRVRSDLGPRMSKGLIPNARHAYGCQWWYRVARGGIFEDVSLRSEPLIRLRSLFVNPQLSTGVLSVDYVIINHTDKEMALALDANILSAHKDDAGANAGRLAGHRITLKPGENRGDFSVPVAKGIRKWDCDNPNLYFLSVVLKDASGKAVSADGVRFGWREFAIKDGAFHLNGKRIFLFGCNPASIEFVSGKQLPDGKSKDKQIVKYITYNKARGNNIARTAHQPITPRFLEIADEMGLMVFHEWAWCFSAVLDIPAFTESVRTEIPEYVEYSYNHPSVTMWSLGNEVPLDAELLKISDMQYDLVKSLDRQNRPISCQSGNFTANFPAKTDLLDYHTYSGLSDPWINFTSQWRNIVHDAEAKYGKEALRSKPMVAWELIGFSWGMQPDTTFRRGNIEDYAKYMGKKFTWGAPNGIGFAGSIPLYKALRGESDFAQLRYGHRIFELIRINGFMEGYAPWFNECSGIPLWTQPTMPSLTQKGQIFPGNLFAGESGDWNLAVSNLCNNEYTGCELEMSLMLATGSGLPLGSENLPGKVGAFDVYRTTMKLSIPDKVDGRCQLRLVLKHRGREIGRNYYDLFVKSRAAVNAKIVTDRPVCILRTASADNIETLQKILKDYGLSAKVIDTLTLAPERALVIVPPELQKQEVTIVNETLEELGRKGCVLLVLEQHSQTSILPGRQMLFVEPFAFTDLVVPEHPVFSGLQWEQFDGWNNDSNGIVIRSYLAPYIKNALAIKGPQLLSVNKLGNAVLEARNGKGLLLMSQLESSISRQSDSAAALYLRNLLAYAAAESFSPGALELADSASEDFAVEEKNLHPIDLRPYANRSLKDDKDNDGLGGWTDQGGNDFRFCPVGRQTVAGVAFDIIDPQTNNDRAALILQGAARPTFPEAIRGIKVDGKFVRLFFMHTAGFAVDGQNAGAYQINYADGTSVRYDIEIGSNCGDWWDPRRLAAAKKGVVRQNPEMGHSVGTFVAAWINPSPDKEISSIDFLSAKTARGTENEWSDVKSPVPILLAITAEKRVATAVRSFPILDQPNVRTVFMQDKKHPEVTGNAAVSKMGGKMTVSAEFPACPGGVKPGVIIFFRPEMRTQGIHAFRFSAKASRNTLVRIDIPEKGWKSFHALRRVQIVGDGQWHNYSVAFNSAEVFHGGEQSARGENLAGEIFVYHRTNDELDVELPPLKLQMRDLVLE